MEDFYHRNKYLSVEKRQTLASQLAIPEQCVSDYFKNLRSRKKHEEHMKCLLKGLENGDKELDQEDSGDAEDSLEDDVNKELPSCSRKLPVTSVGENTPQLQPPNLIKQCGRRYNVTPAVTTPPAPHAKNVSETDLVASKIAALTQSHKSSHKEPGNEPVSPKTGADVYQQVTAVVPMTVPVDGTLHKGSRHERDYLFSQALSSGGDAEERFSLDSLFNGSTTELQDGTAETEALEVGSQIYVVHLNNHVGASVRN